MTTVPAYDNSVRIGYARVSTRTQEDQAQLDALAGCGALPGNHRGNRHLYIFAHVARGALLAWWREVSDAGTS